jgi:hypothetical protein
MPKLTPYTSPVDRIQPNDRGVEAQVMAGRRIGAFYNQAASEIEGAARAKATAEGDVARGVASAASDAESLAKQVDDYLGHREISKGAAASSQLFADLNDQWAKTAKGADPNDPSVAAKFNEQVLNPALDKFSEAYGNTPLGQRWVESHVATMRQHFFQKTAADMTTLAGEAVAVNVRQLGNASSNTAMQSPDFHTVDYLLSDVPNKVAAIVDTAPNLKGADAARARLKLTEQMQEQIIKAGAIGAISKSADPEATAEAFAKRYPQFVNAQEAQQFATSARYYKRLGESEARAARTEADHAARRDFNDKINQLEIDTAPKTPGDPPNLPADYWQRLRALSQHPGASLEPGRLKIMVQNGETITDRLNKPEPIARVSHATTMELLKRIRSTDDARLMDNRPIYEAYGDGKLSRADFTFLNNEFNNLRTPEGQALNGERAEFFKKYAASIDGAMDFGGHSALGAQRMYAFEMDARRVETDLRKKGLDPHLAYDPRSEYFVGRPELLAKYRVSMTDAMNYQKQVTGKTVPAAQGEEKTLGVEVINQRPGAKTFVPPTNWQWSPSRQQYRDPQGRLYDVTGEPLVRPPR